MKKRGLIWRIVGVIGNLVQIDIEFNSGAQLPMSAIPELARLAESHGFGCAWAGEADNKDPTVMLAAIAAATTRLKIGSPVYSNLWLTSSTPSPLRIWLYKFSRRLSH